MTMEAESALFAEQVSLNTLVQNIVYASGTVGAILVVVGLLLIDVGATRRKNRYNAVIEKMIGFFISFATYFLAGFGFWASQYYIMEGNTLADSMRDWWAGGVLANSLAQNVDPALFPGVNNFQIFIFFLACFAGIVNILLHFSIAERIKASAFYVICFVSTIVSSVLSWWTWGSVGPLTNMGFHDFFGVGFVYLFPTGMAMILVRQLGARPGIYAPHPKVSEYRYPNVALAACGVMVIFAGLPMVILSCLFFFDPEALALSVTMAHTSIGVAMNNYGVAWAGGMIMGGIISYRTRNYIYLLFGPLAGYVSGASGFDVYVPWEMFLVALGGPIAAYFVYEFTQKRQIDEHKLFPLFAGAGIYGLLMVGLLRGGTPRGGYYGITEGAYAFQHGEIGILMQVVGIVVCLGMGIVTAAILAPILKATVGLRVSDEDQAAGMDVNFWHGIPPDVQSDTESA